MADIELKPLPLHEYAPLYLREILDERRLGLVNDLEPVRKRFLGALGMLRCVIPKGHDELHGVVAIGAAELDLESDELVTSVIAHIDSEQARAEQKERG